jgi:hypothetical protein
MILLINYALNKLDLYFVVLFDSMSDNLGILCFHGDIVINTGNDLTYNGGIYEFLIVTLDMSLNELFRMLYDRPDWNMFEIEVEIRSLLLN